MKLGANVAAASEHPDGFQAAKTDVTGAKICFEKVSHTFVTDDRVIEALQDIDLTVAPGEFVGLIGPSGCGKTTLLNLLAGLEQPTTGRVALAEREVTGPSHDVAYMLARDALLPWRTAIENVELGLQVRGMPRTERREISREWLSRVDLNGFEQADVGELSQGMRQRVAIARTLSMSPRCVLMDEPFAALDAQTRLLVQQEFVRLWERLRNSVLFVTHDLGEAVSLCDRVVLIGARPGRVMADVTVDLPRPRRLEDLPNHPEWRRAHGELSGALRAEVRATSTAGSAAPDETEGAQA